MMNSAKEFEEEV